MYIIEYALMLLIKLFCINAHLILHRQRYARTDHVVGVHLEDVNGTWTERLRRMD